MAWLVGRRIMKDTTGKKNDTKKVGSAAAEKTDYTKDLSRLLTTQLITKTLEDKYANSAFVLEMVGAGLLLGASLVAPNLPKLLKPLFNDRELEACRRFNIPRLRQTLKRLQRQKLVVISEKDGEQVVEITKAGRRRVIKESLDKLSVNKPRLWDGNWWLVSYDLPVSRRNEGAVIREYLSAWGFYPLHESLYLHAYPCAKQIEFLREYLRVGDFILVFKVAALENPQPFREFFWL